MKLIPIFLVVILFVASIGCQTTKPTDDPEVVRALLTKYFDGIKHRDLVAMNAVTTDDYTLFENGSVWTNDSLVNQLNKFKTFDAAVTFDNVRINMGETTADVVYYNHGELVMDTAKISVDWLESATFRKVNGEWKMNFLHSTVRK